MDIEKIKFQLDTSRILKILTSEIYDSPYAMLRENVQNAYDAILMRITDENLSFDNGLITINIRGNEVEVSDNGIGMTEKVLRENYWQKGASGKTTPLALKSGVIGTFGIGAMANFGVCTKLTIETKSKDSEFTLISIAERDKLAISEECIELKKEKDGRQPGTKIFATLDETNKIELKGAINYLMPYTKYLPIKVLINNIPLSQQNYKNELLPSEKELAYTFPVYDFSGNNFKTKAQVLLDKNARVFVVLENIIYGNDVIRGDVILVQNLGYLMGLRNFFGLAPIPISGVYRFGGIANLSFFTPTAGREAISRESIDLMNRLADLTESCVSDILSKTEYADKNIQFMQYLVSKSKYDLGSRITIGVKPNDEQIELQKISDYTKKRKTYYFGGTDQTIINTYSSEDSYLLLLSQSNPRRQIQTHYIQKLPTVEMAPDSPSVTHTYSKSELNTDELAIIVRVTATINEFYLISDLDIVFAEISHNVNYLVQKRGNTLVIYLKRSAGSIQALKQCYKNAYEVFSGFVNDFVRVSLYPRFSEYVPSSTKDGAEALSKILKKNRESYKLEYADFGNIEKLLSDFASNKIGFPEVLKQSKNIARTYYQTVTSQQVGKLEFEVPNLTETAIPEQNFQESTQQIALPPAPSIMRLDTDLQCKILVTEREYPSLNKFGMFLGLSDNLFRTDYDFFLEPHSTKIIWGAHRIIYIFTHSSSLLTLYYDIELSDYISGESTGGSSYPTTTLITKNRIYAPVPSPLTDSFKIKEGDTKEFFVRYDIIG